MPLPNIATKIVGDTETDGGGTWQVRTVSGQNVYGAVAPSASAALSSQVEATLGADTVIAVGLNVFVFDSVQTDLAGEYAAGVFTAAADKTLTIIGSLGSDDAAIGASWIYITPLATGVAVESRVLTLVPTNTEMPFTESLSVLAGDKVDIRVTKALSGDTIVSDSVRTYLSIQGIG